MEDKIAQGLIALLRCALYQKPLSEKGIELVRSLDLQQLYELSVKHDLAHMVGNALEENRLLSPDDPVTELFDCQSMLAFFRYKQLIYDFELICNALEEAEIPFLPLKGSVIRRFYPEEWMRISCDVDILVSAEHIESAEKVLTQKLQYRRGGKTVHDISLYTPNDVHVELHFSLMEASAMPAVTSILHRVWDYVRPMDGWRYRLELAPEMIYFYHIAHMVKHVYQGGFGVRFLLDTKLLCDGLRIDAEKRDALLREGGLLTFDSYVRRLSEVWFGEGEMDEELFVFHQFIIRGGIYGTVENKLAKNSEALSRNRFQYVLYRLIPSPKVIFINYPVTQRHKWLLPAFYVIRPFHRIFTVGRRRVVQELRVQSKLSQSKVDSMEGLLSMLEINTPDQ